MYLHSPLKMLVGGCSLITSCSIWIFEGQNPVPAAPLTSSPLTIKKDDQIHLDKCKAVDKLSDRDGKPIKDTNIRVESNSPNSSITISFEDNKQRGTVLLTPSNSEIKDFGLFTNTTKDQYKEFDKETIKISLFEKPAWYSDTNKDEFQNPLGYQDIKDLFNNTDEVRVKQLLLSLHNRVEWSGYGAEPQNQYFYADLKYADDLNHLKDLKIKYFKEFEKLKEYVLAKVETCTTDDRACIPTKWEFDYMETDTNKYFQDIWSGSET